MPQTLEELTASGETILQEIEVLRGKLAEAKTDEAKTAAQSALDAKDAEWGALTGKIAIAKADGAKRALLDEAKALAKVHVPGSVTGAAGTVIAGTENPTEGARDAFFMYVAGKRLSDRQMELIRPDQEVWKDKQGADGVVMPKSLARAIMPRSYGDAYFSPRGKAMMSFLDAREQAIADGTLAEFGKTMSSANAGDASLVPQEYIRQLLELPGEGNALQSMVTVMPSSTGVLTIPRLIQTDANEFGVSFTWIDEGGQKEETEPDFEQITIQTFELAGYTEITNRLLSRSAFALEPLLARLYRDAMANQFMNVIINGSGVGQPLGVINTAGIRLVARNTAGTVGWVDVVNLKHALQSYHWPNTSYVLDSTVLQRLERATDTIGRPLWNAGVSAGPVDRINGSPYLTTELSPNVGLAGDIIFANWRWYWLVVEQDVVVKRSEHYRFRNNITAFTVCAVVGGRAVEPRVFAILQAAS